MEIFVLIYKVDIFIKELLTFGVSNSLMVLIIGDGILA